MKAVMILRALLMGLEVTVNGRVFLLSEDNILCVPARNETTGKDVLLGAVLGGCSLEDFINLCERASPHEIYESP